MCPEALQVSDDFHEFKHERVHPHRVALQLGKLANYAAAVAGAVVPRLAVAVSKFKSR